MVKLLTIEENRIIYLFRMRRESGQLYLPDVFKEIKERYFFMSAPQSVEEVAGDVQTFRIGKFQDGGITELSLYPDGLVVTSQSTTEHLESFISDIIEWVQDTFELRIVDELPQSRTHKSTLVVKFSSDPFELGPRIGRVAEHLAGKLKASFPLVREARVFGLSMEVPISTKAGDTVRLRLERRAGSDPMQLIFYSEAPLSVSDHVEILSEIEFDQAN